MSSESVITMYPLDFEEFLWANGVEEPLIHLLTDCIDKEYPVRQAIKLGDYNVGRSGEILTLPLYMGFLLREY